MLVNLDAQDRSGATSSSNCSPDSHSIQESCQPSHSLPNSPYSTTNPTTPLVVPQLSSGSDPESSNPSHSNPSKIKKRTLNTLAARRYRQRRVDQVSGLEAQLKETETERDGLKLKVARLEAEVEVLRSLMKS